MGSRRYLTQMIRYFHNRCPHIYKSQLVEWMVKRFGLSKTCANQYTSNQIRAIWYKESKKRKILI